LVHDDVRGQAALLYPEGVLLLDETAAAVVGLCDGRSTVDIAAALAEEYDGFEPSDVDDLLADLEERRLITRGAPVRPTVASKPAPDPPRRARRPVPVGLLAELTYRCPLRCPYCSNPVAFGRAELSTEDWVRVLGEARAIGVLQVHFSGGEPVLRRDLPELVRYARRLGMYTNLVSSGIPLTSERLDALADAGLDHFQLSIQDSERAGARAIAGIDAYERKLAVAGWVRRAGLPLTVNVVLHRSNVDHLSALADLAAALDADRLELAHTQFYGHAWRNRAALMPTSEQVAAAGVAAARARERYGERMEIVHVAADYHTGTAKPCMYGWGSRQLVVTPNGDVLPCLAAHQLPLPVSNVHNGRLADIWYDSEAFNRFRGTAWLPEPCQSCALKEVDFGGCRCQAYQLTGDSTVTDPACRLSPHHHLVARP
jgi:pyrroloquinoline quinone biosynthesis protein E